MDFVPIGFDPADEEDGAARLAEPGAEDCCVVDCRPKERGLDGGGPAGVVDGFVNENAEVGLLVGVEAPKRLGAWLVAAGAGCWVWPELNPENDV